MAHLELLIVALMVGINAVFAAYEIALASVSISRLQLLVEQRRAGAAAALLMKRGIEKSLAAVQLGITLVGLIAGATGGVSARDAIVPFLRARGWSATTADVLAVALVVLPLTAVTIVIGELVPKLFAMRHKEWVCLRLSPFMKWFAASTWPAVWVLETSASRLIALGQRIWRPRPHLDAQTEAAELQELRALASLARTSRLIGAREENIILGAARLASRALHEIMLPAEHIRMLALEDSLADNTASAHLDMHTRFPVTERKGDPQTIVGYVTFKDLMAVAKLSPHDPSLRGILRPIPSLSDQLAISTAMERMLRERTHIALIRNAREQVVGLITLEDIVEELLGDIQDEYDLLPVHIVRAGHGWIVGGGASLARVHDLTGIDLRSGSAATNLNGWIVEQLGTVPHGGDTVHRDGLRALVRKVRRHRVLEALLRAEHPAPVSPAGPQ